MQRISKRSAINNMFVKRVHESLSKRDADMFLFERYNCFAKAFAAWIIDKTIADFHRQPVQVFKLYKSSEVARNEYLISSIVPDGNGGYLSVHQAKIKALHEQLYASELQDLKIKFTIVQTTDYCDCIVVEYAGLTLSRREQRIIQKCLPLSAIELKKQAEEQNITE